MLTIGTLAIARRWIPRRTVMASIIPKETNASIDKMAGAANPHGSP